MNFWEYAKKNKFKSKKNVEERKFEATLYDVTYFSENQGFIYGFNYSLELTGKSIEKINNVIKGRELVLT